MLRRIIILGIVASAFGALSASAMAAFTVPAGDTVTFSSPSVSACNSITGGWTLSNGQSGVLASKSSGCWGTTWGNQTIGPFATTQTLNLYLTDHTCYGWTFYADGNHGEIYGSNPYYVGVSDAGGYCEHPPWTYHPGNNFNTNVSINPPPETQLSATGTSVSATEGAAFSGKVATVSGDSDSPASDYSATINWGDGSSSAGTVSASGDVTGTHTYAEEGNYTVKASVTDRDRSTNTASASSTASVADAPLSPGQLTVSGGGVEGVHATDVSFAFSDANTGAPASDYTATIAWGDGTTSNGTVSGGNGSYTVSGSRTYAEEGSYPVSVSVQDAGGQSTSGNGSASVADAGLSASGKTVNSLPAFSGTVASFTDANPNGSVADFSATIDWGDGSSSPGTVSANSGGGFDVNGAHTYAQTGPETVKVHITDAGGSSADATTQILIYELAAATGGSFAIGDQNAAVGTQVDFWGSQWGQDNSLSSGGAPASFKGFGDNPSSDPPACGGSYTTAPGNSSQPPATLPAYMGVYVSSSIAKQGSKIRGDIAHLVIVQTDAGYQADPGHPGTGKIVAQVC